MISHGIYSIAMGMEIEISKTKFRCYDILDHDYTSIMVNETVTNSTTLYSNYIKGAKSVSLN